MASNALIVGKVVAILHTRRGRGEGEGGEGINGRLLSARIF
jgi:hypothetical protein